MRRMLVALVMLASLQGFGNVCSADIIVVTFEGPLSIVSTHTDLADRFSVGDLMRVSITYELPSPDSLPADPHRGMYHDSIRSFSVTVDSRDPYSASATTGLWTVHNNFSPTPDPPPGDDQVFVNINANLFGEGGDLTGPDVGGLPLHTFHLQLHDDSANALSGDALPTSFEPTDFDNNHLRLQWRDEGSNRGIMASDLTSTSYIVPLPGAALLGVLGLATLASRLRRQR